MKWILFIFHQVNAVFNLKFACGWVDGNCYLRQFWLGSHFNQLMKACQIKSSLARSKVKKLKWKYLCCNRLIIFVNYFSCFSFVTFMSSLHHYSTIKTFTWRQPHEVKIGMRTSHTVIIRFISELKAGSSAWSVLVCFVLFFPLPTLDVFFSF